MKAAILTTLQGRPLGATRIAGVTGMKYTTCLILLSELREQNMIVRMEDKYQLTEVGAQALKNLEVIAA